MQSLYKLENNIIPNYAQNRLMCFKIKNNNKDRWGLDGANCLYYCLNIIYRQVYTREMKVYNIIVIWGWIDLSFLDGFSEGPL